MYCSVIQQPTQHLSFFHKCESRLYRSLSSFDTFFSFFERAALYGLIHRPSFHLSRFSPFVPGSCFPVFNLIQASKRDDNVH